MYIGTCIVNKRMHDIQKMCVYRGFLLVSTLKYLFNTHALCKSLQYRPGSILALSVHSSIVRVAKEGL